jgi:uncharacterized SAM-binding protein YcdF (DUF218 family)
MFFELSKVLWIALNPASILVALIAAGALLSWTRFRRAGATLVTLGAALAVAIAVVPLGIVLLRDLENRFPTVREPPPRVDGVIVLGGMIDQFVTEARGQLALGGAVERLVAFAELARKYPEAKLIFSGGSGRLGRPDTTEAAALQPYVASLGLDPKRVRFEGESRNTHENALYARRLAEPKPDETWVLITSAAHMPRAVGCFRKAGWRIVPYPVDFATTGRETLAPTFDFLGGIGALTQAFHHWTGLIFYRLTGRTDALFPGPEG